MINPLPFDSLPSSSLPPLGEHGRTAIAEALQASDRTYRALIKHMREGVVIVDQYGIIQFVNERYCEMLGYAAHELLGRHESTVVSEEDQALLVSKATLRKQGISDQYELGLVTRQGDRIWALVNGSPYIDETIGIEGSMGMLVDITHRRQMEEALKRSETQQRALLKAMPDLMIELDRNGIYQQFHAGKHFPWIGTFQNPVGQSLFNQLPQEMAEQRMVYVQQALDTAQVQVYEYQVNSEHGVIYEEARIAKSGENEVLVLVRDISDRKRIESELLAVNNLQQAILDSADYTIISTDAQGIIQTFNLPAQRLLGYEAHEVIGQASPLLFHAPEEIQQRAIALSYLSREAVTPDFTVLVSNVSKPDLLRKDTREQEWTYISRRGDRIPMLLSITPLRNSEGSITGYLMIGRDISVRRRIDAERRKLASVVENSSEFMGLVSPEGTFEFINQAGIKLLGLSYNRLSSLSLADLISPADQPLLEQHILPTVQTKGVWTGELELFHKVHQKKVPVLLNVFALHPDQPESSPPLAIVAQDISELKQASEALISAQSQFRRLFANVPGMIFQYIRHADGQHAFPFVGYQSIHILGVDRLQIQDHPDTFWQMVHPDDRERVEQSFRQSQDTRLPMQQEWRMILPTGSVQWVQGIARPECQENGTTLWDGILIDISDRKDLEEERNQFFNLSPDVMAIFNFEGQVLSINPAVASILGYSSTNFQEQDFLTILHPEDYVITAQFFHNLVSGAENYCEIDNRCRHCDGSYRWLAWRAVAVAEKQLIYAIAHDISEQKAVEQELRRSHDELEQRVEIRTAELRDAYQRLSSLIGNSPLAVVEWNNEFRIQGWSPKAGEIFGWQFGEVLGKHPSDWNFVYDEDIPTVQNTMKQLTSGEQVQNVCQNRNLTKSGEVIYCEWYNSALFDDEGNLLSMLSLVLDVTERKQAEYELQVSQERFSIAFNANPVPLSITSFPQSQHIAVNDAWVMSTGFTREEAIGRTSEALNLWMHAHERDAFIAQLEQTGRVNNMLMHSRTKSGDTSVILLSSDRIELGGQTCLLSACFDISDRIRAEKALQHSKEFSENLITNLQDGFILLDLDGVHIDANPAFCEMTGFSRGDLIGVGIPHPYWPPEHQDTIIEAISALQSQQDMDDIELIFMRKSGQRFPVIVTPTVLYNEQGQPTNYMALIKDISHIKLVQEELRRSRDELELRVQQRTTELADVNSYLQTQILEREVLTQQLMQSNQELEQFAYIASHDLQEPLRAITSYTQLLAQRYEGQIDEKADKYIHYIVDGATYMQQLIQDLLTYSRVGRGELTLEQIDLNQVLRQVQRNLQVAIAEANATVGYAPLPTILADKNHLVHLFQNLVGNSIKYRGDRPPIVQIQVQEEDGEWLISLSDNGIGIDPQYAERIFVIFQRLHTRRTYSGTGIGLAICKKIVERHHGRIWVESQPQQGATFYFTLPKLIPLPISGGDSGDGNWEGRDRLPT